MKILVLGDGKLGSEIIKQTNWDYISRKKDGFDFTNARDITKALIEDHHGTILVKKYDAVINCIANTDTYSTEKESMYKVNYEAVANLSDICNAYKIKLVHISTDYVYAGSVNNATEEDMPVPSNNWYTYYKLLADEYIAITNSNYLICRCSFKSKPFEFKYAWYNQIGNFDYVDVITELIIKLVKGDAKGIYNVGTETKTMLDLAKQTKQETQPSQRPDHAPANISIDISKLKNFLNENTSNNTKP
jgi:dTDP-4-dehydrorhamnose reductase